MLRSNIHSLIDTQSQEIILVDISNEENTDVQPVANPLGIQEVRDPDPPP